MIGPISESVSDNNFPKWMPYENELPRITLMGFIGAAIKGTGYPLGLRDWEKSLCEFKNDVAYRIGAAWLGHSTHAACRAAQVMATALRIVFCVAILMNPCCANFLRINGCAGKPIGNPIDILKYALTVKSASFVCMPNRRSEKQTYQ